MTDQRPLVCILDASVAMTGALMAARSEATLLADRARFCLILPSGSKVRNCDLPEFERVIRLPVRPLRKTLGSAISYIPGVVVGGRMLAKTLQELDCQRLQVNDFYLAQASVARLCGYRGNVVTWVRIDPDRFGPIGRMWLSAARRSSDALVAVSRFIAERLSGTENEIVFDPAPDVQAVKPGGQRFLFLGNYVEGKGQEMAIRAFHRLAGDYPAAELALHGSTMGLDKNHRYRERLGALADDGAGARQIRLDGIADDLAEVFGQSLAALNCSASESFSLTCLEASAHGLPVIATRCGGPEEIVADGQTGFLVDVGDEIALEERMRVLLDDPALAEMQGAAGRERVRRLFGPDRFKEQVVALLDL